MRYAAEFIGAAAIICAAVLLQVCNYRRLRRTREENQKLQKMLDTRETEYGDLILQTDDLAVLRHDLRKYEWLVSAIESENRRMTHAELLNLILKKEAEEAEKLGVSFRADDMSEEKLTIGILDFVSLSMNLLDNAREAAAQTAHGSVEVNIRNTSEPQGVEFAIRNTKNADAVLRENPAGDGYMTDKPDAKEHGYGTQIVRQIIQRQNGSLRYEDFGDKMKVLVWLPSTQSIPGRENSDV